MTGVMWGGVNELVIWNGHSDNGLTIKDNGSAKITGNLDVGSGSANTSINTYVNNGGHTSNVEIEARYQYEAYIHFNTTHSHGLLLLATKQVLYLYCGLNIIFLQTNNKCIR